MGNTQWVTITTEEIVGTYVYRLKPWVDPYSLTRVRTSGGRSVSTGRRAPETTKGPALRAEAYQEYYLVKLPDSTYVLAQFGGVFAGKIKKEEKRTVVERRKMFVIFPLWNYHTTLPMPEILHLHIG